MFISNDTEDTWSKLPTRIHQDKLCYEIRWAYECIEDLVLQRSMRIGIGIIRRDMCQSPRVTDDQASAPKDPRNLKGEAECLNPVSDDLVRLIRVVGVQLGRKPKEVALTRGAVEDGAHRVISTGRALQGFPVGADDPRPKEGAKDSDGEESYREGAKGEKLGGQHLRREETNGLEGAKVVRPLGYQVGSS
jgi:hypothetical protein